MKNRNFIILSSAASLLLYFSASCSVLQKFNIFPSDSKTSVTASNVLPQDREQIQQQASFKTYSPEELSRGIVKGDWAIEEVNGKPAVGQTAPYIKFVPESKRIYGNNGCNVLNAEYKCVPADSLISFSNILTTMMSCNKQGITDYEINSALANTVKYSWQLENNDYYIYLYDRHNVRVMTLMHQNFQFLNGTWRVVTIDEESVDIPDMKLVIDVDEEKVHGNTGCNILNGSFTIDMDSANSISFQNIVTTRMACQNPELQTRLIVALENASHAKPISSEKVLFLDNQGVVVLTLIRTSDK